MGKGKGKGKLKGKSVGMCQFSTDEEIVANIFVHPSTFKQEEIEAEEEYSEEEFEEESHEERRKGVQGLIEVENPNWGKPNILEVRDLDIEKITQLFKREKNEIDKQKRHEYARKDLERLTLIRQQRVDAAKKREEEKLSKRKRRLRLANDLN
ncbi:hypothetical protein PVL29_024082 [Vitis rotundifolia]|uniref:Casein kinase substrate phosphoprotein PP28 domain-containing protein n=1 Tax=Vitis rotundifolia TaxID=103349 RepID=A0AA38YR38_VITRO|nr:hypothetical protein PVL29_024082 [Vitis rotundifolia]